MTKRKYDFAGWVTKNDIKCSDGVTIKHDAFRDNDGQKVPLVWNHDYNSPNNVLGHVILQNQDKGVYGFGYFNDTDEAKNAKELVRHGDIASMSIGARKIKRSGSNVIHGKIYEVSLVMSGANPGAMIETVVNHSEDGDEEQGVIYTGNLIHSSDDILEHKEEEKKEEKGGKEEMADDKTIGDIVETMNDEQKEALYALVGMIASGGEEQEEDKGDDETVKQNVFNGGAVENKDEVLKHSLQEALDFARKNETSLKDVLQHMAEEDETLQHGINSIEMLFPEAVQVGGNEPQFIRNEHTAYQKILSGVRKSPFAKVKTLWADVTEEEARAKGYIKGNMKREEFFSLIKRETAPTTIYKKQKIDRDDLVDITDFDVVSFMNREMRFMLEEEIARAILIGDGRDVSDEDKIDETKIRPIIKDHDFFVVRKTYTDAEDVIETVLKAKPEYRGSGSPTAFIDPALLVEIKLLKGDDGRYLQGHILSDTEVAAALGVKEVVESVWMEGLGILIVNLNDYQVGSSKGGQITNFDDFDIDFNQYKYLTETRLSGSLLKPKSAMHFTLADNAVTGMNATAAQLTYGMRQADKVDPEDPEDQEG